jgi:hypothetical protein
MNDTFCLETGESRYIGPGQPRTNTAGDSFKTRYVSAMSFCFCDKSSGLRTADDGKNFLVSGSNQVENYCFEKTNETKSWQ